MPLYGRHETGGRWLAVVLSALAIGGCEAASHGNGSNAGNARARRARETAAARLAQDDAPKPPAEVPSHVVGPSSTQPAVGMDEIHGEILLDDPSELPAVLARSLEQKLESWDKNPKLTEDQRDRLKRERKSEYDARLPEILKRLEAVRRQKTVHLSFTEVLRHALEHNHAIQAQSYSPAIETSRIVEAEAQFDAVYFINFTNEKQDRPSSSELQGTALQLRNVESGVRKLLSAGTNVQVSYALNRTETDLVFATINPSYFNTFTVEFRQPFLRGFGLDFNRSQIEIYKLDRAMSVERLRRDVRELVFNVEQAYWQLLQARAGISIAGQLLADLVLIYKDMEKRLKYDTFKAQLALPQSKIEQHEAEFIRLCNNVRNAEDVLKRLTNDPDLNLARDVELLPTDALSVEPIVLDQVGEVAAALLHRSELREAKLTIEQAEIAVGAAKNQALPKLDVMFRYIVDGLGPHPHGAFSQLSENDFHEYFIGLEFEVPIGNRAPEAALRRARFQQAQAIAAHRDAIENVILEVQQAVRDVITSYDQIGPSYRSALAASNYVEVVKARLEEKTVYSLQLVLDAHEALAGTREQLLQALINYNIALSNLERQKGTLLRYNNIAIKGADDESHLAPYRPVGP